MIIAADLLLPLYSFWDQNGPMQRLVTTLSDSTGIQFSLLTLSAGEALSLNSPHELACLHLAGKISFTVDGTAYTNERLSLFDQAPWAAHVPPQCPLKITALSDCECALFETRNASTFAPAVYTPDAVTNERRGEGQVGNCALRYVRTIFDNSNSDPATQLVLGEVVNFPGRWSSYPPHHHPQPEIYHYRFSDPRGYGHAELGEDVLKVRHGSTVKILDGVDHSQCSAPGYAMYYLWVIRHLPQARYTIPEFTEEHRWTLDPHSEFWGKEALR